MITRSNVVSWMHKQKWGLENRPQVELGVQASVLGSFWGQGT